MGPYYTSIVSVSARVLRYKSSSSRSLIQDTHVNSAMPSYQYIPVINTS